MPTTAIATFGAGRVDPIKNPDGANVENINLKPSTTFVAGTLVGEIAASPGVYGAYASGNSDGTQKPTHILQYGGVTDASGNITLGTAAAGAGEWGQTQKGMPAYRSGEFSCADLTGYDANVNTIGRALLVQGTVSAGRMMFLGN